MSRNKVPPRHKAEIGPLFSPYQRPPIVEAVIEFRFSGSVSGNEMERIARKVRRDYPVDEVIHDVIMEPLPNGLRQSMSPGGRKFSSACRSEVLTISMAPPGADGAFSPTPSSAMTALSVSQLAPYAGWEAVLGRFLREWGLAEKILGHRKLNRIGVRFINRIDIPGREGDFRDWIRFGPSLPDVFPTGRPSAFQMQCTMPINDTISVNIGCATLFSPLPNHWALGIDIDVFTTGVIPDKPEERVEILGDFRVRKNHIFENCITGASRELFR